MTDWKRGDTGWAVYVGSRKWNKITIKKSTYRYMCLGANYDDKIDSGELLPCIIDSGELHGVDSRGGRYCLSCCQKEKT